MPKIEQPPKSKKGEPKVKSTKEELSISKDVGSVYVERGITKNMGDYNSARITVGITLPINPTPLDIEAAKEAIKISTEIVEKEIISQIEALDEL